MKNNIDVTINMKDCNEIILQESNPDKDKRLKAYIKGYKTLIKEGAK